MVELQFSLRLIDLGPAVSSVRNSQHNLLSQTEESTTVHDFARARVCVCAGGWVVGVGVPYLSRHTGKL